MNRSDFFFIIILMKTLGFKIMFFQAGEPENLFVNYLSRIHREEVPQSLAFIIEKDDAGGH